MEKSAAAKKHFLFVALLSCISAVLLLSAFYMRKQPTMRPEGDDTNPVSNSAFSKSPDNDSSPSHHTQVCFALIDNRHKMHSQEIANYTDISQIKDFIANELMKPNNKSALNSFRTLSVLLTKHYSIKHGYKVFVSNGRKYEEVLKTNGQKFFWSRLHFVLDLMDTAPECDWYAYLDSDNYPWMHNHELSLDDYFSTQMVSRSSSNYVERKFQLHTHKGYFPWHMQKEVFLVGLNGDVEPTRIGSPKQFLNKQQDYLCSGLFFVKNSEGGRKLLHDWIYGAADYTHKEKEVLRTAGTVFAYEQRVLNYALFKRYMNVSSVYSYSEMHWKDHGDFRHVWGQWINERIPRMVAALKELGLYPNDANKS